MPYLVLGGYSIWGSRVAVTRMSVLSLIYFRSYILLFTIDKDVCVKDSSAEGTCVQSRTPLFYPSYGNPDTSTLFSWSLGMQISAALL